MNSTKKNVSRAAIASRLRIARERAGLSQNQVANIFGWHRPTVSEIEAGRRRVAAEEMVALAELYGVNIPWIVGAEENSETQDDRITLAARELGKLKENDLERVLELVRSLKE